jgi:hypothetical protein
MHTNAQFHVQLVRSSDIDLGGRLVLLLRLCRQMLNCQILENIVFLIWSLCNAPLFCQLSKATSV